MTNREMIVELARLEDGATVLFADGFDDALIGVCMNGPVRAVYDWAQCIRILEAQGMSPEEAEEYFAFNVEGAYVGEQTPLFIEVLK